KLIFSVFKFVNVHVSNVLYLSLSVHSVTCDDSLANLQCGESEGQVLLIHGADYGRRDSTTCSLNLPASQLQNVQCSKPISILADSSSVFGDPCFGTYKYLEMAYSCHFHSVTCEGSQAKLQCEGQVIVVYWANFGRRDNTTCPDGNTAQLQNVTCLSPNSPENVTNSCNWQNSCTVEASNTVFGDPCGGTYKYLEVVYDCIMGYECVPTKPRASFISMNSSSGEGQVIVVSWANYGRRDTTTCPGQYTIANLYDVNCFWSGSMEYVTNRCNGKNSCTVEEPSSVDPCVNIYKYLEVFYTCQVAFKI
uniref:SUEL-type lectin domain-containing protein n=1 Tax=Oreochromis niloticus TaxID=8128 RepID=A0A669CTE6_ORENI